MGRLVFVLMIFSIIGNSSMMAQFSEAEKQLIYDDSADIPMRILQTQNGQDSLFLRQKCSDIDIIVDNAELEILIERMKATLIEASGVGLAAPQVGIGKNIFLFLRIDKPDWPIAVAINPKIVNHTDETVCFERDGCLSISGVSGNTARYPWIDVEYTNEKGELVKERLEGYSREGNFVGIIFQHEFDHLQGILFTDRLIQ